LHPPSSTAYPAVVSTGSPLRYLLTVRHIADPGELYASTHHKGVTDKAVPVAKASKNAQMGGYGAGSGRAMFVTSL